MPTACVARQSISAHCLAGLAMVVVLAGCAARDGVRIPAGNRVVAESDALILPAAGGPAVLDVVERNVVVEPAKERDAVADQDRDAADDHILDKACAQEGLDQLPAIGIDALPAAGGGAVHGFLRCGGDDLDLVFETVRN